MGLFTNPLGHAGYPANTSTAQVLPSEVRAATAAEVTAGVLNNVYVSPLTTAQVGLGANFASPSPIGSVAPNTGAFTTLHSSGSTTLGTTGATVNTIGSSNASSTTTITAGSAVLGVTNLGGTYPGHLAVTAPAAGFIGEEIRSAIGSGSAVTSTTTTVTNVTSVSLTAGIWNVSGIVMFTGMTTATLQKASIGTTSATIGTLGDNAIQGVFASTTAGDFGLSIPAYRISLATTTTVYLVGEGTYSAGTGALYGRISATRVA
jgi:hypothetical protein